MASGHAARGALATTTSAPASSSCPQKASCSAAMRLASGSARQPYARHAALSSARGARTSTRASLPTMSFPPNALIDNAPSLGYILAAFTAIEREAVAGTYQIGTGRPPLAVGDLPEPEDVFDAPRLGPKLVVTRVIGPSLIALGLSIGSGEWLLGPQAIGELGWIGVGFVILLSILLQAFYNVEIGRYVMA